MAPFATLDFLYARLNHTRRTFGGLYHCAKFGWSRCSSFDNTQLLRSLPQSVPILYNGSPLPLQIVLSDEDLDPIWYMIPWAAVVLSLQPKRHLDRFSHFCTAHMSSGMPGHVLSPNIAPGMGDLDLNLSHVSLYPVYTIQPVVNPVVNKHPTGCQSGLTTCWMFVYTIQPVVKPVVQRGLTTVLNEQTFRSTGCQTGLYNRFDKQGLTTMLNEQPLFVQLVVQPGLTTGCIHDTAGC